MCVCPDFVEEVRRAMAAEVTSEEQYDLTSVIGGYLDRHLVFPMLEFLSEKKVGMYISPRSSLRFL